MSTISEAREALIGAVKDGAPPRPENPKRLKLLDIHINEQLFQHRGFSTDLSHVNQLVKALKRGGGEYRLDPITVWWGGDRWYVVDGHHRREAYRRTNVTTGIPVERFEGDLDAARCHAGGTNSKLHLAMSTREKTDMAWRLMLTTDLSIRRLAEDINVAESTIDNMRKARRQLREMGETQEDLEEMTWPQARQKAKGEDEEPWTEDRLLKKAQALLPHVEKAFGGNLNNKPELVAKVIELADERLPMSMMEASDAFDGAFWELARMRREDHEDDLRALVEEHDDDGDY